MVMNGGEMDQPPVCAPHAAEASAFGQFPNEGDGPEGVRADGFRPDGSGRGARLPHDERQLPAASHTRRLIAAANELLALAAELEHEAAHPGEIHPGAPEARAGGYLPGQLEDDVRWLRHARRTYRNRRTRGTLFGDETMFGEPAWDILLDLFIAAKEGKRVPVTSACIGAAVPTTTALRWLTILEERGLVLREADTSDARRIFVRLSTDAYAKLVGYFAQAASADVDESVNAARTHGRTTERPRG